MNDGDKELAKSLIECDELINTEDWGSNEWHEEVSRLLAESLSVDGPTKRKMLSDQIRQASHYLARAVRSEYIGGEEFWKGTIQSVMDEDGVTAAEAVRRELHDFKVLIDQVPEVYAYATGDATGKANVLPSVMKGLIDTHIESIVDEELTRWQNGIQAAVIKAIGDPGVSVDGGGCDSGDPLDFTISEVNQGMTHFADKLFDAEKAHESRVAELLASEKYYMNLALEVAYVIQTGAIIGDHECGSTELPEAVKALQTERNELASQVCDECTDGKGYGTLTKDGEKPRMVPCVCVTETEPWKRLEADRNYNERQWRLTKKNFDLMASKNNRKRERILELETERDKLQTQVDTLIEQVAK